MAAATVSDGDRKEREREREYEPHVSTDYSPSSCRKSVSARYVSPGVAGGWWCDANVDEPALNLCRCMPAIF